MTRQISCFVRAQ